MVSIKRQKVLQNKVIVLLSGRDDEYQIAVFRKGVQKGLLARNYYSSKASI